MGGWPGASKEVEREPILEVERVIRDLRRVLAVHKVFIIGLAMFPCESVRIHGYSGNTRLVSWGIELTPASCRSIQVKFWGRGPLGLSRSLCVDSRCYSLYPGAELQSPSLTFGHLRPNLSFSRNNTPTLRALIFHTVFANGRSRGPETRLSTGDEKD